MIVSVIVPCYNAEAWIVETLQSVAEQNVELETIVVDDGSTDRSLELVRTVRVPSLRIISQRNLGASAARNRGTQEARGTFIQYLDADDVLEPNTLGARVVALQRTNGDVAYCDWIRWERQTDGTFKDGEIVRRALSDRPDVDLFTDAWWPPGALMYRRTLVDRILPWREDLPIIQDARFLLDAALTGGSFVHVDATGLRYRVHGSSSLSRRDPLAFLDDIHRNAIEVDRTWHEQNSVDAPRRRALVSVYSFLARSFFTVDRARFQVVVSRLYELDPNFLPEKPSSLRVVSSIVGYPAAEHVAASWRRLKGAVGLNLTASRSF
jgi:glycosyltransferase involved in cell wall biosynthesis